MRVKELMAFAGFILLVTGTYCPLLRPFGLLNWDVYDLNKPWGIVILMVAVIGIIGLVLQQPKVSVAASWASLILVVLLFIAALLKVHTSFSFIPFQSVSGFLSRQIKFKWGWYLLFGSSILTIIGLSEKKVPARGKTSNNSV